MIALIVFIVVVFLLGILYKVYKRHSKVAQVPVIPSNSMVGLTWPRIGNSHSKMLDLAEVYGPIAQCHLFGQNIVIVNDGQLAKKVLRNITGKGWFHRGNENFQPANILNLDTGPDWLLRRTSFKQSFAANKLRGQQSAITALVSKLCTVFDDVADSGKSIDVDQVFSEMTVDVICEVAFQLNIDALSGSQIYKDLNQSIRTSLENAWLAIVPFASILQWFPVPFNPFHAFHRSRAILKEFQRTTLIHLRKLQKEGELRPDGFGRAVLDFSEMPGVSEEDVCAEIGLMFVAGHETTAHTLTWLVYALAKNTDIQSKVQASVDEWLSTANPVGKHCPAYLESAIRESMRRYPVVSTGSLRLVSDPAGIILPLGHNSTPVDQGIARYSHTAAAATTPCPFSSLQGASLSAGIESAPASAAMASSTTLQAMTGSLLAHESQAPNPTLPLTENATPVACRQKEVREIYIPRGTWIQVNFYALHNCSANWGPDALVFKPERWMPFPLNSSSSCGHSQSAGKQIVPSAPFAKASIEASPVRKSASQSGPFDEEFDSVLEPNRSSFTGEMSSGKKGDEGEFDIPPRNPLASESIWGGGGPRPDDLSFAPFSHGPRNCLGMNLALLEIRTTALELCRRYGFALEDERMLDESVCMETHVVLRPRRGIPILVTRRKQKAE